MKKTLKTFLVMAAMISAAEIAHAQRGGGDRNRGPRGGDRGGHNGGDRGPRGTPGANRPAPAPRPTPARPTPARPTPSRPTPARPDMNRDRGHNGGVNRPNRPNRPDLNRGDHRRPNPMPSRPAPAPSRPDVNRGDRHRPPSEARREQRRDVIQHRQNDVRRAREQRRTDIRNHQVRRQNDRQDWRQRRHLEIRHRDVNAIRSPLRWTGRYNTWWGGFVRPRPVVFVHVSWYQPMPAIGSWDYFQTEQVAENIEYLTRGIYEELDAVAPTNTEYGQRLRRVLYDLVDAAENYEDAVESTYDFSDTLYDLFYLEEMVGLTEQTLDGYSQAYRVSDDMAAIRYYVNELLWTYRQNY